MNMTLIATRVMAVAALLYLSAAPEPASAQQSSQPALAQPARMVPPAARPMRDTRATDDLAGLQFTDEQKAKIDEIHQHMATRKDAVIKSEKLDAEQKAAMIAGLGRMERGQIVKLLTPEQQREVLSRMRAGHPTAQEEQRKPPLPQ